MNDTTDAALDATSVARNAAEVLLSGGVINGLNLEGCAPHLARNVIDWSLAIEKLTAAYEMAEAEITALRAERDAAREAAIANAEFVDLVVKFRNERDAALARASAAFARGVHDAADLLDSMRRDPQYAGEGCDPIIDAIRALASTPPAPVVGVNTEITDDQAFAALDAMREYTAKAGEVVPQNWRDAEPEDLQYAVGCMKAAILAALLPQAKGGEG